MAMPREGSRLLCRGALEACYLANENCTGYQLLAEALQEELEEAEDLFFSVLFEGASYGCWDWSRPSRESITR
jgi:hypothetical protein